MTMVSRVVQGGAMLRTPLSFALTLVAAGCASAPERIEPRFQAATPAEAAAADACRQEVTAYRRDGEGVGRRMAAGARTANQILIGQGLTEQNLGLYALTAPIALLAGATTALVGAGVDRVQAQAAVDRAFAVCVRRRDPVPAALAGEAPVNARRPARDGAAELRALGVEPPR